MRRARAVSDSAADDGGSDSRKGMRGPYSTSIQASTGPLVLRSNRALAKTVRAKSSNLRWRSA